MYQHCPMPDNGETRSAPKEPQPCPSMSTGVRSVTAASIDSFRPSRPPRPFSVRAATARTCAASFPPLPRSSVDSMSRSQRGHQPEAVAAAEVAAAVTSKRSCLHAYLDPFSCHQDAIRRHTELYYHLLVADAPSCFKLVAYV